MESLKNILLKVDIFDRKKKIKKSRKFPYREKMLYVRKNYRPEAG